MGRKLFCLSLLLVFSLYPVSPAEADVAVRRADWLEFGGELRLDMIVPEEAESYVEMDQVELDIKALLAEGVYTQGTFQITKTGDDDFKISVPEWYTRFSLGNHWLKMGLTPRFIAPGDLDLGSHRTAGHPLISTAFWRDEQHNITLGGMIPGAMGEWRYRLSYGSGLRLADRRPGDHRFDYTYVWCVDDGEYVGIGDEMLHDDDHHRIDGDEIGLGLGYRHHFYPEATLDLVGFGIWSRIPGDERPALYRLVGWPQENDQQRLGVRVVYEAEVPAGEMLLMAGFIAAEDGKLDRDAWFLQASHEFEFPAPLIGDRFLTAVEPLIRYGHYNVDVVKYFIDPLTWDRQQLTLALLTDLVDNVSLRIEYDINTEDTGGREIENNEFRVQLRARW